LAVGLKGSGQLAMPMMMMKLWITVVDCWSTMQVILNSTVDGSRTTVFLVGPGGLGESLDFLAFPFHGRLFGCGPHTIVEFSAFCFFFPSDFVMGTHYDDGDF
jgi:hypothetical protein